MPSSCARNIERHFLSTDEILRDSTTSTYAKSPCTDYQSYIPDSLHPEFLPKRYVRVRFFIVRHDEHDRQFDIDTGTAFIKALLESGNNKLRQNEKMVLPIGNQTPKLPIQYEYVLYQNPNDPNDNGVKVIIDSSLAYFNKKSSTNGFYDKKLIDKYGIPNDSVYNLFILEHHPDSTQSKTYNTSMDGVGFSTWGKIVNYYSYRDKVKSIGDSLYFDPNEIVPTLMNHEFGHSFGLSHSWSGDGCDDTPNHPNCWDQFSDSCKETGIFSNNMMDYNNRQIALTPCQIGKIHLGFSRDNGTSRKLLLPLWCEYKPEAAIVIPSFEDIEWNGARDFESDIIIQNNASLTIRCRVALPQGAKIIIKPKGKLIIDGGYITNICNGQWEGIEIWANGDNRGEVVIKNGGKLEKMKQEPTKGKSK
ncbi:MAG: M43 family zinc metalloprotease [Chitinophagales bacterium]|nr:M43 family zinc metalloprotease [Chitinophagales bacterium]